MTLPELTPDDPDTRSDTRPTAGRVERVVEALLVALVLAVAAVVGLPQVVGTLREGSVELATVFYPALLAAFGVLAWTRRTGR